MCFPGRYLHLNVSQFSDPSSLHRLARVKALPAPQNPETVLHILGDTVDKEYPIFRTDTASDHVDTLCTGVWCVCTHICVHVCMHECMCMHFSLKDVGMWFVLGAAWPLEVCQCVVVCLYYSAVSGDRWSPQGLPREPCHFRSPASSHILPPKGNFITIHCTCIVGVNRGML